MISINPKQFYQVGIVCFSVIALMSLIGWIAMFSVLPWYAHIQKLFSIIFNIALVGLFVFFLKQFQVPQQTNKVSDEELSSMLKEYI